MSRTRNHRGHFRPLRNRAESLRDARSGHNFATVRPHPMSCIAKWGFDPPRLRQVSRATITLHVHRGTTGRRYVGITKDLSGRLREHCSGRTAAGRMLGDFRVILTEEHPDHASARVREVFLKSGQGRRWLDNYEKRTEPAQGG
jgi:putative endonuclease